MNSEEYDVALDANRSKHGYDDMHDEQKKPLMKGYMKRLVKKHLKMNLMIYQKKFLEELDKTERRSKNAELFKPFFVV